MKEHVQVRLEETGDQIFLMTEKSKEKVNRNLTHIPKSGLHKKDLQWYRTVMTPG